MITPRATRLVRVDGARHFRDVLVSLSVGGEPWSARDRLVLVPTRAAAQLLRRSIEARLPTGKQVLVLPDFVTRDELLDRLAERVPDSPPRLTSVEREVLLASACRDLEAAGVSAPFRVRAGLVVQMLELYDALRRRRKDLETFERLTTGALEPDAAVDRGAERLLTQTRFLVAAFRELESRTRLTGRADEHLLREHVLAHAPARPWRHVVVSTRDIGASGHGLWPCDYDLLTRLPGLTDLDVVVTEAALVSGVHERIHDWLPDLLEERPPRSADTDTVPQAVLPPPGPPDVHPVIHLARDREEEIIDVARRVKGWVRGGTCPPLDRIALVVRRPLPYLYLARDVMRAAGVPIHVDDALPLAAEPYAALIDLIVACVTSGFARARLLALVRSPLLVFPSDGSQRSATAPPLGDRHWAALDRALTEAGFVGGQPHLERLLAVWADTGDRRREEAAGRLALDALRELAPLTEPQPARIHLAIITAFLNAHERNPLESGPHAMRARRARTALRAGIAGLSDAYAAHDDVPVALGDVAATLRTWIERHTFDPRGDRDGVRLVDAESALFGDFSVVQLAGLVEGDWPQAGPRTVFYPASIMRSLDWPGEAERLQGERALFRDLQTLPRDRLLYSAFALEEDALVSLSTLAEDLPPPGPGAVHDAVPSARILEMEALAGEPPVLDAIPVEVRAWATARLERRAARGESWVCGDGGRWSTRPPRPYSVSALERFQDCPFKFFAADVLRLAEPPEDRSALTPRTRGQFVHEVLQRCFESWEGAGGGVITPERFEQVRTHFAEVARSALETLPATDAALERARLLGSPMAPGLIDVVLAVEASRPEPVKGRWLEYRLEGEFTLGGGDRRVPLRGVVDRIDLLEGRRLRVLDYKSGSVPAVKRSLQVPVYALAAIEELERRGEGAWTVDEAAYVALSGARTLVPVIKAGGADAGVVLGQARERVFAVFDAIDRGEFPVRPHEPLRCRFCAYPSVCRKDYVDDE